MKKGILFFVLLFLSASVAKASLDLNGYLYNDIVGIKKRSGGGIIANLTKLRLRFDSELAPWVRLHLEPEVDHILTTEQVTLFTTNQLDSLMWDRSYFKFYLGQNVLTVGKQRIAWGTGYIWNPTDVVSDFVPSFAISEEERQGVRGVRLEVPWGWATKFEAFYLTEQGHKKGLRARTNLFDYDLSASYIDLGEDKGHQYGFDYVGEFVGLGVRGEIAFITPQTVTDYSQYCLGANYTLDNGWGLDGEYYFNGLGAKNKSNYDWTSLFAGDIDQLAREYIYFGVSKMLDELSSVRFSIIQNMVDFGYIFYPSYTYNILQNVDLSFEALIENGTPGSEYQPTDAQDPTGFMGSNFYFMKLHYHF